MNIIDLIYNDYDQNKEKYMYYGILILLIIIFIILFSYYLFDYKQSVNNLLFIEQL